MKSLLILFFASAISIWAKDHSAKLDDAALHLQKAVALLKEVSRQISEEQQLTEENYQRALSLIQVGNFGDARKILIAFSKADAKLYGPKVAQSFYWLGYCLFKDSSVEDNFQKATFAFVSFLAATANDATDEVRAFRKNANKLLVSCFQRLSRPADAIGVLDRMKEEFPEEAEWAQALKQKLAN